MFINCKEESSNISTGQSKRFRKSVHGKLVFDERRAERISEHVIAQCHQCGAPCDSHVNCANQACHLLFIQCDSCNEKRQSCCSSDCQEIVNLPMEEQRKRRKENTTATKSLKRMFSGFKV